MSHVTFQKETFHLKNISRLSRTILLNEVLFENMELYVGNIVGNSGSKIQREW